MNGITVFFRSAAMSSMNAANPDDDSNASCDEDDGQKICLHSENEPTVEESHQLHFAREERNLEAASGD
jgi:hypothetical protein